MIGAIYSRTGHKVLQDVFHIHLTAAIFLNSTLDIMVRKTLAGKASCFGFPFHRLGVALVSEEQFMEPIRNVISNRNSVPLKIWQESTISGRRFAYITTIQFKSLMVTIGGYTGDTSIPRCAGRRSQENPARKRLKRNIGIEIGL